MAMHLRGKNFVSEIKHISLIQESIESLTHGEKYYFSTHINGVTRVYYVSALEDEVGRELSLYRDYTEYYYPTNVGNPMYVEKSIDELIKTITSKTAMLLPTEEDSPVVSYSENPEVSMSEYVMVYLDALQTTTNY